MPRNALIIMDMQKCFINDKTKKLSKMIKCHIEKNSYDFVVFSKFQNKNTSSFATKLNWTKCIEENDREICEILKKTAKDNNVFEKKTYSIFKIKKFNNFLRERKVKKLYFCGIDLDACILASAYEAFDLGYDFEILFNLSGSTSEPNLFSQSRKIINRNLTQERPC
ncbi:cysteine hydrolase [Candidatus Parcubacteria bacterium]|nr:MAG: cysteine hydrolase [Candidatus Parcubacteria bacterium]